MADVAETRQLLPQLKTLSDLVEDHPECFASGSKDVQAAALDAAKFVFDLSLGSEAQSLPHISELLSSLSPSRAPQTRSQTRAANAKRKRSPSPPPPPPSIQETPLTALFVDGMDEDQIWAQLDLRNKNICDMLEHALEGAGEDGEVEDMSDDRDERLRKALEAMENGEDIDLDALMGPDDEGSFLDEDEDDEEDDEDSEDEEDEEDDSGDDADLGEGVAELNDPSDEDDEDEDEEEEMSLLDVVRKKPAPGKKSKVGARTGLDDGFFNLATFNAETEAAEARLVSKGSLKDDESDDDDMSVDLFAPVDDVENFDEEDLESASGETYYRDFFEPPPRTAPLKIKTKSKSKADPPAKKVGSVRFDEEVRVKKIKAKGKNLPLNGPSFDDDDEDEEDGFGEKYTFGDEDEDDDGEDDEEPGFDDFDEEMDEDESEEDDGSEEEVEHGRETIERLKDDLFAEDEETAEVDLSTHEKRLAALREQIKELETENVGPKDWVLMGEAGSRARPQNSLLEEDLEFERVMKAVPVVTEETVLALEERIKARILESQFDDVVRVRPMDDKPFLPSRFFELKDSKSSQSLAQIYEDEYTATASGGVAGEDRDGKLKKEHDEIDQLWENICNKLDALCNAHYMPKQPKATISTVANVSTATLESALPTTKSATTMLAPEEVFAPSASDLRARSELTPTEKRALRTKERKLKKKTRETLEKSVDKYAKKVRGIGGVKKQKQAALESIVKSGKGVTVVGKTKKDILAKKDRRTKSQVS